MLKKCYLLQVLMQQQNLCSNFASTNHIITLDVYKRIIILIFSKKLFIKFQFIFSRREISSFPFHLYVYCESRDILWSVENELIVGRVECCS